MCSQGFANLTQTYFTLAQATPNYPMPTSYWPMVMFMGELAHHGDAKPGQVVLDYIKKLNFIILQSNFFSFTFCTCPQCLVSCFCMHVVVWFHSCTHSPNDGLYGSCERKSIIFCSSCFCSVFYLSNRKINQRNHI